MSNKVCPCCKKELPITEFGKNKSSKDGLYCYCKTCENIRSRKSKAKLNYPPIDDPSVLKICRRCKKEYPATVGYFSWDKNSKDGLQNWCKICSREANRKSMAKNRSTPEGRAKANEANRKSRAKAYADPIKHIIMLEANKKASAKLYATNPEFREKCKKKCDKRRRDYDGIRLAENIIDEPVIRHHVNDNEVIDIPRDIHTMYPTRPKEVHRFMVNQAVEQLYNIKCN